jgi:hypothetical protein
MEKGDRKGSGGPSLRAAAKQSSVSFLDCHGAETPRNDGFLSPSQVVPAFFDKRPDWPYLTSNKGSFLDQSPKINTGI